MAKPYLNIDLVDEPEQQPIKPQTPNPIKHTEWEKQQQLIPLQYYDEGDDHPKLKMHNEQYLDLNKLLEALEKYHKMKITQLPNIPIISPPKSLKKESLKTQLFYNQLMRVAATNPQEATLMQIEGIKQSIAEMIEYTKEDNGTHLAETLDIDRQKLMENIVSIEDWAKKAASAIKSTETKALAHTIDFSNLSRSSVTSTEYLANMASLDNIEEEYPTQGLIFNQKPGGKEEKPENSNGGAALPTGPPQGYQPQRTGDGATGGGIQQFNIFQQNEQGPRNMLSRVEHKGNGPYYCSNEDHLRETPQ